MSRAGLDGRVDEVFSATPMSLAGCDATIAAGWLRDMILIREFELALDPLAMKGLIPGGVHCAVGQEAVAVGIGSALAPQDVLACGHRAHHHSLAKGVPVDTAMAELFGRQTGVSGGRGGTMHMADLDVGLIGGNGIVGAGVGIALGSALAAKMTGADRIAVGIFGDGGANTGRVWEAMNLAAIWSVPLIVICENNQYAVQTPIGDALAGSTVAERALAFGLPATRIDGQDVTAVYAAMAEAKARALAGEGPSFIEMVTYRYLGHSTGEAQTYRTEAEVEDWRSKRDPISRLADAMLTSGSITEAGLELLGRQAKDEIAAAVSFATSSPWPDPADALTFVGGSHQAPPWAP